MIERTHLTPPGNYRGALGAIIVIGIVIAALLGYQVVSTYRQNMLASEHAATHARRVEAAERLVQAQQLTIESLFEEYHVAAYENPLIDRISEQQLLAEEAILGTLQIIAIQNSQIIQLLATTP